jgi:hypothetical protein
MSDSLRDVYVLFPIKKTFQGLFGLKCALFTTFKAQ